MSSLFTQIERVPMQSARCDLTSHDLVHFHQEDGALADAKVGRSDERPTWLSSVRIVFRAMLTAVGFSRPPHRQTRASKSQTRAKSRAQEIRRVKGVVIDSHKSEVFGRSFKLYGGLRYDLRAQSRSCGEHSVVCELRSFFGWNQPCDTAEKLEGDSIGAGASCCCVDEGCPPLERAVRRKLLIVDRELLAHVLEADARPECT